MYERCGGDPGIFERFRNFETGELVKYGPGLSLKAFEARGVELQSLRRV
jgi:hypothetical protein